MTIAVKAHFLRADFFSISFNLPFISSPASPARRMPRRLRGARRGQLQTAPPLRHRNLDVSAVPVAVYWPRAPSPGQLMMLQPEPATTATLPSRQGALPVRPKPIRRHGGAPRYDERLPRPAAFRHPDRVCPP